jgi:hypothetical protein
MNTVSTKIKSISFDTLFRENYQETNAANFEWTLTEPLEKVQSMRLSSIEIPNKWYLISSKRKNNRFTIHLYNFYQLDENDKKNIFNDTRRTIIIPDGNYNESTFPALLNSIFEKIGSALNFLMVEINPINNKTIIRCKNETDIDNVNNPYNKNSPIYSPNFSYKIKFEIDDVDFALSKTIGWIMGFREMEYHIGYNDFSSTYRGYLSSESCFNPSINTYLYFVVDENRKAFRKEMIISEMKEISEDILAKIPVSLNDTQTTLLDNHHFKKREYRAPVKIESFSFSLLDKFGEVLDLNKNDYSFLLEFTLLE